MSSWRLKITVHRSERTHRRPRSDDRETVAAYLHRWLAASAAQRVRPRTLSGYRLIADKHLIPAIGRVPVAKLTPAQVQAMLNAQAATGASLRRLATSKRSWDVR